MDPARKLNWDTSVRGRGSGGLTDNKPFVSHIQRDAGTVRSAMSLACKLSFCALAGMPNSEAICACSCASVAWSPTSTRFSPSFVRSLISIAPCAFSPAVKPPTYRPLWRPLSAGARVLLEYPISAASGAASLCLRLSLRRGRTGGSNVLRLSGWPVRPRRALRSNQVCYSALSKDHEGY